MMMMMLQWFLWVVLILTVEANTEKIVIHVEPTTESLVPCSLNHPILKPPYTQLKDSLTPSSFSLYHLLLEQNKRYEIRISYPATSPTDFELKTLECCQHTNHISYLLKVSAHYTGVSTVKGIESKAVEFHLVLETLYAGVLFYQVYKIILAMLAVLCLGQFVLLPYLKRRITIVAQQKIE